MGKNVRMPAQEQIVFARRLSAYLHAGVPILEALSTLAEDAHTRTRPGLEGATRAVASGMPLSGALQDSCRMHAYAVAMIEVGERSGTLKEALSRLSVSLAKQRELTQKLVGALAYPAVILLATAGISLFLVLYAFPKIVPLFRGFGAELPFATRALIALSDFLGSYGVYLFASLVAASVLVSVLMRRPRIRLVFDRLLLGIPFLGNLIATYQLSSIARTLTTLLSSGVSIVPALALAERTCGNRAYAAALSEVHDCVIAGERIADALVRLSCFPRMYVQMIATGERTGSLPASLNALAEQYEEEFRSASSTLTALIEPVLMVVMGLVVGFVALAIITPVYQITQDMHG